MSHLAITTSLLALAAGELNVGTEVRAGSNLRNIVQKDTPEQNLAELSLLPSLSLFTEDRTRFRLSYSPSVVVPVDVGNGAPELQSGEVMLNNATVVNQAELAVESQLTPWRLRGAVGGSYGQVRLLPGGGAAQTGTAPGETPGGEPGGQAPGGDTGAQPVQTTGRIPYFGAHVSTDLGYAATRAIDVNLLAVAALSSGDGPLAQATLPEQRELRIDTGVAWRVTRRDTAGGLVSATGSNVERGNDAAFIRAGGTYRRQLLRPLMVNGTLGLAWTYLHAPEDAPALPRGTEETSALPFARSSIGWAEGGNRPSASLALSLEPAIDRISGAIDVRAGAEARLDWAPLRSWSFGTRLTGAALRRWGDSGDLARLPTEPDTRLASGDIRATRTLGDRFSISAGGSSTWQVSIRDEVPSFRETAAFFELAFAR